jgi:hypothetical protein
MILTSKINIRINKGNKATYQKILKKTLEIGEIVSLSPDKLSPSSKQKILVQCDLCQKELETTYHNYLRNYQKHQLYTCKKCSHLKSKKTCLVKYGVDNYAKTIESKQKQKDTFHKNYGVDNPQQNPEIRAKTTQKLRSTRLNFIIQATRIHNSKYDYSQVDYLDNKTPVKIICPEHGLFEQRPDSHLNGKGCYQCANRKNVYYKNKKIYLLYDEVYDLYKIGVAHNPHQRKQTILNETHQKINLIKVFEQCGDQELILHNYFEKYKRNHPLVHGGFTEWFQFPFSQKEIISQLKNILQNY